MPASYSAYHNLWQQLCNMMVLICTEKTTLTLLPLANPSRTTTFRKICFKITKVESITHTDTFNSPFPGLPRWAGTRKVKPIWILLKQETASGSGISWATCKSAPCSRQITTPAPHHSVFYRPDALPVAQPTALKQKVESINHKKNNCKEIGKLASTQFFTGRMPFLPRKQQRQSTEGCVRVARPTLRFSLS